MADLRDLPFAADRFDLVFCESLLNFVADKTHAIRAFARLTKPGGYGDINELFWLGEPVAVLESQGKAMLGTTVLLDWVI